MTEDRIDREISIAAPVERVWAVLTEQEHVAAWFSPGGAPEVDLRPGGTMQVDHGAHGTFPLRIEKIDPPHYLSYRWASAFSGAVPTDANSTLVEFTLTPDGAGTRLAVAESGFASLELPAEQIATEYASHTGGWAEVLGNLVRHVEQL